MAQEVAGGSESRWPRSVRLSEAHADPLRLKILSVCGLRETSPQRFHAEVGGATLAKVRQAFELLAQYGWLELTRIEGEGGEPDEVERFYRGTEYPIFDQSAFEELPGATRALVMGRVIEALNGRTKEALKAGTLANRTDQHLSCTPIELDEQGWDELISRVDALFHWLFEASDSARARLAESGDEPVPVTVGLLAFESPKVGE